MADNQQWTIDRFERTHEGWDGYDCSTYKAESKLEDQVVQIEVMLENCEMHDHAKWIKEQVSPKINWALERLPEVKAHLAQRMIELALEWQDDPEEDGPITIAEFQRRVELESIQISATGEHDPNVPMEDGNFILMFFDDDIFAGHSIELWVRDGYQLDNEPGLMG